MTQDIVIDDQPRLVRLARAIWSPEPFLVFAIAFGLGALPAIFALFASQLGDVVYLAPHEGYSGPCDAAAVEAGDCYRKQVGYAHALNWLPALGVLMPLALFFAFESVQNLQATFRRMRDDRMFIDESWEPEEGEATRRALAQVVRLLWTVFAVAALAVSGLVMLVMALDWACVVALPLARGEPLTSVAADMLPSACGGGAQEIDWSIAAAIPGSDRLMLETQSPNALRNGVFSAYVYLLMAIELCFILSYFAFIGAVALVVRRIRSGKLGVRLVPNFRSRDPRHRMGFEHFEPVFRPCVYVTILSFVMAFMLRIQNEYLRDRENESIWSFMFTDISKTIEAMFTIDTSDIVSFASSSASSLGNLRGVLDVGAMADPNSQIVTPLVIVVFGLISIALGVVLRDAALDARRRVERLLDDREARPRIEAFYGEDAAALAKRLRHLEVWPLSWPRLRQSIGLIVAGVFCLFFYKLALAWVAVVGVRAVQGRFSEDPAQADGPSQPR
jgi:hypothetical protein